MVPRVLEQKFSVPFDYPVVFTRGLFTAGNPTLADVADRRGEGRRHRMIVCVDDGLLAARPGLPAEIEACIRAHPDRLELVAEPRTIPGGERCKNSLPLIADLLGLFALNNMDRQSFVLVVGGGAVLDAVGLAAALFHRGLRLVRVPTTVLAQNDAGVGVKNAINHVGVKNLIGTFAPPFAVINDLDFLDALPDGAWRDGIAEAFKVAVIKDADFFHRLCALADALRARDAAAMEELVVRCADLHLQHIRGNGDPFEFGRARPLDFGHWSAHKLEQLTQYRLSHGAAVAIGLVLDAHYAVQRGWFGAADFEALYDGLTRSGLALWHEALDLTDRSGGRALLDGLREFREHLGGELCVTMPRGLGDKFEVDAIDPAGVEAAIAELRRRGAPVEKGT
jgi:3-dehydroquinate synthase